MVFRQQSIAALTGAVVAVLLSASAAVAQGNPGLITLSIGSGSDPVAVAEADALIARMIQDGQLVLQASHGDTQLPGRQHEGFSQYVSGVPVHGASLSRQTQGGTTVSIFGTVYTGIDITLSPTLSMGEVHTLIEQRSVVALLPVAQPLTILPTLDGDYALAYRVTATNAVTYFVDAHDGQVLMEVDEKRDQSEIGFGRGVSGDAKKVSATRVGAGYEAQDQLRPASILTLDTRGSAQSLVRLVNGTLLQSDVATDADNTWTNPGIVDTHVHLGWSHDYFIKRHDWRGLDGRSGTLHAAFANQNVLPNSAFFLPPPYRVRTCRDPSG